MHTLHTLLSNLSWISCSTCRWTAYPIFLGQKQVVYTTVTTPNTGGRLFTMAKKGPRMAMEGWRGKGNGNKNKYHSVPIPLQPLGFSDLAVDCKMDNKLFVERRGTAGLCVAQEAIFQCVRIGDYPLLAGSQFRCTGNAGIDRHWPWKQQRCATTDKHTGMAVGTMPQNTNALSTICR